jgi:hypothetical protein
MSRATTGPTGSIKPRGLTRADVANLIPRFSFYRPGVLQASSPEKQSALRRSSVADSLTNRGYDCIMIGASLRVVPRYLLLFEKLINVVHRHAPASTKLCFSSNPSDTAEAVRRWV